MEWRATVVPTKLAPCLFGVACAMAASISPAHADAASVNTLLTDPARLAQRLREIDPLVAASHARVLASVAEREQSRVYPNPEVSAAVGGITVGRGNRFAGQTGPTSITRTSNITVGVSELFEIGKRGPRYAAAAARTDATEQEAIAALGDRLATATDMLGKLAYLSARRDVVAANLDAAQKLLALEKTRYDHQDLALVEYERIALDTSALELQLKRADAELTSALATCGAVLQQSCSLDGLDASSLDHAASLPTTMPPADQAILGRPAREASRLTAKAYEWDATLAEKRSIPDPTVSLGYTYDTYEYSGSAPNTLMFSVGIPLPLFDTGKHDAAAARASAKAVEAEDSAVVRESTGNVATLFARRDALDKTLVQLEQQSLPSSTMIIQQTRKAFDLGQSTLADLLLVERAHRDLLLEVLDTRFELFEVRAQLRDELGLEDEVARSIAPKHTEPQ
jgi:outer membrane protein, heavy metal efflux system